MNQSISSQHPELFDQATASKIPINIRFGTSTWAYPGWRGLVYHDQYKNERDFREGCLAEYVRIPWFRTVGIDSTFYAPPSPERLAQYAKQVPANFVWAAKVWNRITTPKYPEHKRYGTLAGQINSDFLNAQLFIDKILRPWQTGPAAPHCGPLIFQFPTISNSILTRDLFLEKLASFLVRLPKNQNYAIEIRNPEFLSDDYFSVLNTNQATHCFNHWNYMPSLRSQMQAAAHAGGLKADFLFARLLTPHGHSYSDAVQLFEPYNQLKRPNPTMRSDVVLLIRRAMQRDSTAFIIVNNRCEGNSPLTIAAIGHQAAAKLHSKASRSNSDSP